MLNQILGEIADAIGEIFPALCLLTLAVYVFLILLILWTVACEVY